MSQPTRTASNGEDPQDRDTAVEQPTAKADPIITRETVGNEVKVGRFSWTTNSVTVVNSPNNRAVAFTIGMIPAFAACCLVMFGGHILGAEPWISVTSGVATLITTATILYLCIRSKQQTTGTGNTPEETNRGQ